jgi:hypothetical protein
LVPVWLHWLSILSLLVGLFCCAVIILDEWRYPQHMWIMNVVWPTVALFGSGVALWAYYVYGKLSSRSANSSSTTRTAGTPCDSKATPFAIAVAKGTTHCGSGCAIGDIAAEWLAFAFPVIAIWFGWHSIFHDKIFAVWVMDFILAFILGIVFQYFTIKPMRSLSVKEGLIQAAKADTASLIAWQIGMYSFMAIAHFLLFPVGLGMELKVDRPEFWFMMQVAMWCGFATSYPVNWWLIRAGIKEEM